MALELFLLFLAVGYCIGFLAALIFAGNRDAGIVGSFILGLTFSASGWKPPIAGQWGWIFVAAMGAMLLIAIVALTQRFVPKAAAS